MKRGNELQKPSHILVFNYKKGKATFMKMYDALKSQRLVHQIEISKISGIDLKMRCIYSKRSNDMMCMKPNEKFQNYVIKFCGKVIYAYFYN